MHVVKYMYVCVHLNVCICIYTDICEGGMLFNVGVFVYKLLYHDLGPLLT